MRGRLLGPLEVQPEPDELVRLAVLHRRVGRALEEVRVVAQLAEQRMRARAGRGCGPPRTSRKSLLIASHISPEICSRTERAFSRASSMHVATAFALPRCHSTQSLTLSAVKSS